MRQMRKKHGKDALELIPVYQALGRMEQSKGDHADHDHALENFMQAHSIASARFVRKFSSCKYVFCER